jgi:hypothetical protein
LYSNLSKRNIQIGWAHFVNVHERQHGCAHASTHPTPPTPLGGYPRKARVAACRRGFAQPLRAPAWIPQSGGQYCQRLSRVHSGTQPSHWHSPAPQTHIDSRRASSAASHAGCPHRQAAPPPMRTACAPAAAQQCHGLSAARVNTGHNRFPVNNFKPFS